MTGVIESFGDAVTTLRIDNAPQRNALSRDVLEQLHGGLERATDDPAVRAIVITGDGSVFCSGGDRSGRGVDRPSSLDKKTYLEWGVGGLARRFLNCDKPIIAAVNGPAVGAGMDLALWCDFRLAVSTAYFRAGYIDLGLPPGFGAAWNLRQLVGPAQATEILLTGRKVDADELRSLGLVSTVSPTVEQLDDETRQLAGLLAQKPPSAMRLTKRLIRQAWAMPVLDVMDLAASHFGILQDSPEHAAANEASRGPRADAQPGPTDAGTDEPTDRSGNEQ